MSVVLLSLTNIGHSKSGGGGGGGGGGGVTITVGLDRLQPI